MIETLLRFSSLTHSELQSELVHLSEMARSVAAVELDKEHPETFSIAPGVSVHGLMSSLTVC